MLPTGAHQIFAAPRYFKIRAEAAVARQIRKRNSITSSQVVQLLCHWEVMGMVASEVVTVSSLLEFLYFDIETVASGKPLLRVSFLRTILSNAHFFPRVSIFKIEEL